jgi:hypothetical protein
MTKIILFVFVLLVSIPCLAQEQRNKTVLCAETESVLDSLASEKFNEKLQWTGTASSQNSRFALMVNAETDGWTLIQFNANVACVLGTGDQSKFFNLEKINLSNLTNWN